MEPVSIAQLQRGEVLYFTDLKRRIFESAIQVLRHEHRRWNISSVRRMLLGPISDAYDRYAAAVAAKGSRAYTLPESWDEALTDLIEKIAQLFFETQEADEPDWQRLEEKILRLAKENGIEMLHLPICPLSKVPAVMDLLEGPLE